MTDTKKSDHLSEARISDAEWANRRLCPDGNCIGVIGPDGRCKECGRPSGDDMPLADDALSDLPTTDSDTGDKPQEAASPSDNSDNQEDTEADEWENRRLCPDGNCIGVIGPDGRCKECGRPANKT